MALIKLFLFCPLNGLLLFWKVRYCHLLFNSQNCNFTERLTKKCAEFLSLVFFFWHALCFCVNWPMRRRHQHVVCFPLLQLPGRRRAVGGDGVSGRRLADGRGDWDLHGRRPDCSRLQRGTESHARSTHTHTHIHTSTLITLCLQWQTLFKYASTKNDGWTESFYRIKYIMSLLIAHLVNYA